MPRSNWEGFISFGLVSIPILLFTSEDTSQKVVFHQIDKRNHARIKYKRVNAETGKEVPWEDIIKGYEYSKDEIFEVEEGELNRVIGENARTIAIECFVNADSIDLIDVEKTYYVLPGKKGEKGYVILREALSKSKKIGIAKVIISTKEYLAAVAVHENALVLYLLHYNNEIRSLSEFDVPSTDLKKYKVTTNEIHIAKQLIQSMTKKWEPKKYVDEYKETVHKWAQEKAKKLPHTTMQQRAPASKPGKVIDFVGLLKKSLKESKSKAHARQAVGLKKAAIHAKRHSAMKYATKH
jgi:DNA end-binding protein Ku